MSTQKILDIRPLGFPWQTQDPFLFCAFHEDFYPRGNAEMGPDASLAGRNLGSDFQTQDGWRMYHGSTVPGFPSHPHRGFETVTVVQKGLVDHADSLGAAGRFGNGDVQWMTAGKGVQHSEMFPLLNEQAENPFLLFQIWLNLPKKAKFVPPHFAMLWRENIPVHQSAGTAVTVIAGQLGDDRAPAPAPDSWAADPSNEVAIWTIKMDPGASWTIPAASDGLTRTLYFFKGNTVGIDGQQVKSQQLVELQSGAEIALENGDSEGHFLFLQGTPDRRTRGNNTGRL